MGMIRDRIIKITETQMPIDEQLIIRKHRIAPADDNDEYPRICIVTGIHGDELEGQFVCYELARRIRESAEMLRGIVDIYPAMNPIGIDSISRGIPAFDLDMNRIFPGSHDGDMNEYMASEILADCVGASLCLDIHASNIFLTEIPQIRINEIHKESLIPFAEKSNMDLVWVHGNSTVLESTFAYSMNSINVPTLVIEMGVGMRITCDYGLQLTEGILNLMKQLGIWDGPVGIIRKPVIAFDQRGTDVYYLNAPVSGVYIKECKHGSMVETGQRIGHIIDPLAGKELAHIEAPGEGWLFTTREYPIVEAGSLMGRILKKEVLGI